jgi:hypothetical protein
MATAQPDVMGSRGLNPVLSLRRPVVQCRSRGSGQLAQPNCREHFLPARAVVLRDPILLPQEGIEEAPQLGHELQVVACSP